MSIFINVDIYLVLQKNLWVETRFEFLLPGLILLFQPLIVRGFLIVPFLLKAIFKFLGVDANIETKKRKPLRPNPIAPWELRIGKYRVFYEIKEEWLVRVLAIGHKEHNDLFIRGERVEI
jgi:hypothetical protein